MQKRIWDRFQVGAGSEALEKMIVEAQKEDSRFHMDGGSWTNCYGDYLSSIDRPKAKTRIALKVFSIQPQPGLAIA